jgi:hypothetical protein
MISGPEATSPGHDFANSRDAAAGPVSLELRRIAVDPAPFLQPGNQRRIAPDAFRIAFADTHQDRDTFYPA